MGLMAQLSPTKGKKNFYVLLVCHEAVKGIIVFRILSRFIDINRAYYYSTRIPKDHRTCQVLKRLLFLGIRADLAYGFGKRRYYCA